MIKKIRATNNLFGFQGGIGLFGNSSIKKKDLNWKQAKARYPRLSPFGDADRDGVKNKFDCHPFDRKRQDDENNAYGKRPWDDETVEKIKSGRMGRGMKEAYEEAEEREAQRFAAENISRIAKQRRQQGRPFSL